MVDRMGEAGFGAEIHGRRESLSEMNLRGQAADLLSRGASGNEISRIPGPAMSTCHRLMGEAHPQEAAVAAAGRVAAPMAYHAKAALPLHLVLLIDAALEELRIYPADPLAEGDADGGHSLDVC